MVALWGGGVSYERGTPVRVAYRRVPGLIAQGLFRDPFDVHCEECQVPLVGGHTRYKEVQPWSPSYHDSFTKLPPEVVRKKCRILGL